MDGNSLIGILGVLILLSQALAMAHQRRLMEVGTLQSIRDGWRHLRPAWIVTVSVGGSMYVDIDDAVLSAYPSAVDIKRRFEGTDLRHRRDIFKNGPPTPELTQAVRDTLEYLALVCGLVLRGHVRPGMAYEALGTAVVENGADLRRVLDEPNRSNYPVYYPGMRRRVLILLDILRVEALQARDVDDVLINSTLTVKTSGGTGPRTRQRMRAEARRISGWWRGQAFEWYLTDAEALSERTGVSRVARRIWRFLHTRVDIAGEATSP